MDSRNIGGTVTVSTPVIDNGFGFEFGKSVADQDQDMCMTVINWLKSLTERHVD